MRCTRHMYRMAMVKILAIHRVTLAVHATGTSVRIGYEFWIYVLNTCFMLTAQPYVLQLKI